MVSPVQDGVALGAVQGLYRIAGQFADPCGIK